MKPTGTLSLAYLDEYHTWRREQGLDDVVPTCRFGMIGPGPDFECLQWTMRELRAIERIKRMAERRG